MRGLVRLISRYYVLLIFLGLQAICFFLIFNYNRYHKVIYLNSSRVLTGSIYEMRAQLAEYITLGEVNDSLATANANLRNNDVQNYVKMGDEMLLINDTIYKQKYEFRSAKAINVSLNRQNNFVTLNKGSKLGVSKDSGIISGGRLVGIVQEVSDHFSVVMSVINSKFRCTVKLKGELGQLSWDGYSPSTAIVSEIPPHLVITPGDSVWTSGFSKFFPEHVLVGTVEQLLSSQEDPLKSMRIKLAIDYRNINHVNVVTNLMRTEQVELEQEYFGP